MSSAKGRASERLVLRRAMAEEDSRDGAPGAVAEAIGTAGAALYEPGAFQRSGLKVLFRQIECKGCMLDLKGLCTALLSRDASHGEDAHTRVSNTNLDLRLCIVEGFLGLRLKVLEAYFTRQADKHTNICGAAVDEAEASFLPIEAAPFNCNCRCWRSAWRERRACTWTSRSSW